MLIQALECTNRDILEELIYHAIFVPEGEVKPDRSIIYNPDVFVYIDHFGLEHDCGVYGTINGKLVGGAWTRIIDGYGSVDEKTPELAISVLPEYRDCGIGGKLMNELFARLIEKGYTQTSLAVQKANPAVRFYERLGYEVIGTSDEEFVMMKKLV